MKKLNDKIFFPYVVIAISITISIFTLTIMIKPEKTEETVSTSTLSNQKIGWGIKRKDNHDQPDLGDTNEKLIKKYNGIAIGNDKDKSIYLTFDAGYEAGYTTAILDSLKEKNVKATFFITAHYLNTAEELVKRMIDEGHVVGNHTVNHKSMPDISNDQIKKELMPLNQSVYEKFEYEIKYMRPPKGEFSERTLSFIESLGFKTVMWSFAYVDWNEDSQPTKEDALNKIISNLHNGEIMLLHSTSKTNSEIMSEMIDEVRKEGYEFKNLDRKEKSMRKKNRLNQILEMPKEVYSNIPNLIITGFEDMIIENYKGILEYEDYYVRVNTFIGIVNVHGINLKLEKMTEDNIKIIGKIESIELERAIDE